MTVGIVLVSHSAKLSEGVAELATQMAPGVRILPAGGLPDGSIGTDFDLVSTALDRAESGSGVVLLYDLGSAQMVADIAVETLGNPESAFVVDAPFVEGAVAAAVAAEGGASLDDVAAAAASAGGGDAAAAGGVAVGLPETAVADVHAHGVHGPDTVPAVRAEVVLLNEFGLHARPAAVLARSVADLRADVRIRFGEREADARSVLALMELGSAAGASVQVTATGHDAEEAVRRISELAARQFTE